MNLAVLVSLFCQIADILNHNFEICLSIIACAFYLVLEISLYIQYLIGFMTVPCLQIYFFLIQWEIENDLAFA